MHQLRRAQLIPGTESPAGDGVTGAMRCVIEDDLGKKRAAVIKGGSREDVAAEATAALLLSGWGLPVPEPFLVFRGDELCFASADVGYPNLMKRFNVDLLPSPTQEAAIKLACGLVCRFRSTPLAIACDEAIDNRDRNLGNVLWDGENEAWIDHARSFGVGGLRNTNKLCEIAVAAGETEAVQRGAVAQAMMMDRNMPQQVGELLHGTLVEMPVLLDVVVVKLNTLAASLIARFPQPDDLFEQVR